MTVYEDGKKLYEQGAVELEYKDNKNTLHFVVKDKYYVDVSRWNAYDCSCYYGISHGVNGALCKHKIAAMYWIINQDKIPKDGPAVTQSWTSKNELSKNQLAGLRKLLDCEKCGNPNPEIHRIERKGPYVLRNILPLCKDCHKEVHGKEKGTINR